MAENYTKALLYLDNAFRLFPSTPARTVFVPQELERYEAGNDGYKAAMTVRQRL